MSMEHKIPQFVARSSPYRGNGPSIVQFTVDPHRLCFEAVHGRTGDLLGFEDTHWLEPGFWTGHVHPDDRQEVASCFSALLRSRTGCELEYRMLNSAGTVVWVHQICEFESTESDLVTGYLMDITQQVIQQADIARVMALRDALMRVVSTELSEPINAISGYAKLLERHLSSQRDDVGSDYALGMREGIQNLNRTINRLRAAAQSEKMNFEDMIDELSADDLSATTLVGFADQEQALPPGPPSSTPD